MTAPLIFKIVVIALLVIILASLASAMFFLVKDKGRGDRTAKSLTFRIVLSVLLFLLLLVGFRLGWIKPHGIMPPDMGKGMIETEKAPQ
ncbi:MAG: twin transmembrane helix small protein [Gammaproteobacteria bacterium]|nr:twin transmembrane helix small protein [Gammaproteobacteria bacterium]